MVGRSRLAFQSIALLLNGCSGSLKVREACDSNVTHSAEQRICMKPVWEDVNNQRIVNVPLSNAKAAAFTLYLCSWPVCDCRVLVTL